MILIEAELIFYKQESQDGAAQPHRQAQDVDDGQGLVFEEVSVGYFEIVSKHDCLNKD